MRHELPTLRAAFNEFGGPENPQRVLFDRGFIIVMSALALGVLACIAAIVFA